MTSLIQLSKIKKIKTTLRKWLTETQLNNRELLITEEMGFMKIYTIIDDVELGLFIEESNFEKQDIIYKINYNEFDSVVKSLKGKNQSLVTLEINKNNLTIVDVEEIIHIIPIKSVHKKEIEKISDENNLLMNCELDFSLDFLKTFFVKNDIELFNYTNIDLNDKLTISSANVVSVGNVELKLKNEIKNNWNASILNSNMLFLTKFIKADSSTDVSLYKTNKLIFSSEEGYIKVPFVENDSKKLLNFNSLKGEEIDFIDASIIKADLKKILLPYKGATAKLNDICVEYKFTINGVEKRVNSHLLNKTISKLEDIKICLFNKKADTPIVIKDNNCNGKILFNILT